MKCPPLSSLEALLFAHPPLRSRSLLLSLVPLLFCAPSQSCTNRNRTERDAATPTPERILVWPAPDRSAMYAELARREPTTAARLQRSAARNQRFLEAVRATVARSRTLALVSMPETQTAWERCPTQDPACLRSACRTLRVRRCVLVRVLEAEGRCHAIATIENAPFSGSADNEHAEFDCTDEALADAAQQLAPRLLGNAPPTSPPTADARGR